jgi:hypothetical protein
VALIYNGKEKGWTYTPEKTTYDTSLPTFHFEDIGSTGNFKINLAEYYRSAAARGSGSIVKNADGTENYVLTYQGPLTHASQNIPLTRRIQSPQEKYNEQLNNENDTLNKQNTAKNNFHLQIWNPNGIQGIANAKTYTYLDSKQAIANKKNILTDAGFSNEDANTIIDRMLGETGQYRNYYLNERVPRWDPSVLPANLSSTVKQRTDLGNNFNKYADDKSGYYIDKTTQGRAAKAAWDKAVAEDNLDIVGRYDSLEAYAKQDYLNQITDPTRSAADIAAIRGSQERPLSPLVTEYQEKVFPDAEKQETLDKVQNKIFGLVTAKTPGVTGYEFRDVQQGLSDLITNDKTINKIWTDAKNEVLLGQATGGTPGQWTKLTKSLGVKDSMITDKDSFGTLLSRVATLNAANAGDKKIIDDNNALFKTVLELKQNAVFQDLTSSAPVVNEAFTASVQASEAEQIKTFGEMRQNILRDTIDQLKIAKQKENNLAFFRSSSVGQELTALTQDIKGSLLGDLGIGGINPLGSSQQNVNKQLDVGLGDIFGTKNGLIYNWEDWFNNEIEKKYAGGIDIPNDYVPPKLRTQSNGFVDNATTTSWKKYDDAYAILKTNPNDLFAKSVVANVPTDYVSVADRKTVNKTWTDYEAQLKTAGYVDPQTLASWAKYDEEYDKTKVIPANAPVDYIVPEKRMNKDVQFAKDFFSTYLKPRYDNAQTITEFQDYIDVVKNTQNPFQTQDRLNALKLAAETSVSKWFAELQKAGDSKFNADYYFDPGKYLKDKGIGDSANPLIGAEAFNSDQYTKFLSTEAGAALQKTQQQQADKVNADWTAAQKGETTTNADGKIINWLQEAYNYGVDVTDKEAFARLHYQLTGLNAPKLDANGNIIRNAKGDIETQPYDAAPNVYAPEVSQLYISYVLTPILIDKANKIGSVFGEFIKPSDYVEQVLKAVNLPENKEQWANILQKNGLDPNSSLTELKDTLVNALTQDSTLDIKTRLGKLIEEGKTPTQTELGVEYLQKPTVSGTTTAASGVYAIFKNAGYSGNEKDFYATFLPDASQEDINIMNAAYTPAGKVGSLLPTISGTGTEQIASMAQLFGDSSITEVLGTAGISVPTTKPGGLGGLLSGSDDDDVGIGDPFADTDVTFGTVSKNTKKENQMGIGDPFDTIGISDPFAEDSDPFFSNNPFSSIGSTSSVSNPTIKLNVNASTQRFSSSKNNSMGSLFDSFGGF